jgi:N utilization substance protein B
MPRAERRPGTAGPGKARLARHKAREFAVQGLYQWLVAGGSPWDIVRDLRESDDYAAADAAFVERLVPGTIADADELSAWMQPFLDRPVNALSPVERAILLLAGFELRTAPEAEFGAPYRVVINEAVELAKVFGGTDGHKYVNGVVDKLAGSVRAGERAAGGGRPPQ